MLGSPDSVQVALTTYWATELHAKLFVSDSPRYQKQLCFV